MPAPSAVLRPIAWFNIGVHVLGLVLAVIGLRPGTPLVLLEERLAYLSRAPVLWSIGWGTWAVCALALLAFLWVVHASLQSSSSASLLAVVLAGAGVAIDVSCEAVYITVLPGLAASTDARLFLAAERALGAAGAIGANGLYSVAVLVMTLALRSHLGLPRLGQWLGFGTSFFGMLMVVAGVTGIPTHLQLATGPTIGLFCAWTLAVTLHVTRPEQAR